MFEMFLAFLDIFKIVRCFQHYFEELWIVGPRQMIPCIISLRMHLFSALYDPWSSFSEKVPCHNVSYGRRRRRLGRGLGGLSTEVLLGIHSWAYILLPVSIDAPRGHGVSPPR